MSKRIKFVKLADAKEPAKTRTLARQCRVVKMTQATSVVSSTKYSNML